MKLETVSSRGRGQIREAYQFCRLVTIRHYENFPVVTRFISRPQRRHLYAAYAFMRTADDIADEDTITLEQRLRLLMAWQNKLDAAFEGRAEEPIFVALADTVKDAHLPKEDFDNLLNAFKVDLFKNRYQTFGELLEYCSYSANPVGRIVLRVMGYGDHPAWPDMQSASDKICTALQLVNHLQDVFVDRGRNRLYLPAEDMERHGYSSRDWEHSTVNDAFRSLLKFEIHRAMDYFEEGEVLLDYLKPWHRRQIQLVLMGGRRIADKIRQADYDVLRHRPIITGYDKIRIALQAVLS